MHPPVACSPVVLAACLLAMPATAQLTVVIPDGTATAAGSSIHQFPWGRGGGGLLHQSVYDGVNFTAQGIAYPITIRRLRWRPHVHVSSLASSYPVGATVGMSTCPVASTAVTTTFANQRGADHTVVFSGPVSWPAALPVTTGPAPFLIDLPLTAPFTYDPTAGSLLIEVDLPIQNFTGSTLALDVQGGGANASRVMLSNGYTNGGPNATTNTAPTIPHGVVVEVTYDAPPGAATAVPYGKGCFDRANSVYEQFAVANAFDLGGAGMSMSRTGSEGYLCGPPLTSYRVPGAAATPLLLFDDDEVTVALGSPLAHPGGTTTALVVSSNGLVSVSAGNGVSFTPSPPAFLAMPQTVWATWHDYDPSAPGSGQVKFEEAGAFSYVTWHGVFSIGSTIPNTLQFQFDRATGDVHLHWPSMPPGGNGYLVGFKAGGQALDPGNRDISATLPGTFPAGRDHQSLTLAASAPPITGSTIQLETTNAGGGTLGLSVLGLSLFDPGIDLTGLGMPGCHLLVGTDVLTFLLPAAGAFRAPLAVPGNPGLVGLRVGSQSAILGDVGANAAGIRTSNALLLLVGRF